MRFVGCFAWEDPYQNILESEEPWPPFPFLKTWRLFLPLNMIFSAMQPTPFLGIVLLFDHYFKTKLSQIWASFWVLCWKCGIEKRIRTIHQGEGLVLGTIIINHSSCVSCRLMGLLVHTWPGHSSQRLSRVNIRFRGFILLLGQAWNSEWALQVLVWLTPLTSLAPSGTTPSPPPSNLCLPFSRPAACSSTIPHLGTCCPLFVECSSLSLCPVNSHFILACLVNVTLLWKAFLAYLCPCFI